MIARGTLSWPLIALGEITVEVKNGLPEKPYPDPPGCPMLRISAVRPGRVDFGDLRYHRGVDSNSYELRAGDLLFVRYNGNSNYVAACGMVREVVPTCVYPDKLIRVRLDRSRATPEWVEFALQTSNVREQLRPLIKTAAGQHGISGKDLRRIEIPLPPLSEQHRIVARIEALFARTRRARADLERIALLARNYWQQNARMAFNGEQSSDWKLWRLEDLISEARIGLVRAKTEQYESGGIPYVRMQHYDEFGRWQMNLVTQVNATEEEMRLFELKGGDLLFNTRNSVELVGKMALWPEGKPGHVFNNNLLRLRFQSNVSPDYVRWAMMASGASEALKSAKSATTSVAAIYQRDLMRVQVPLPDFDTQCIVATKLSAAFALSDMAVREATRVLVLFDRLEQSILTRAFHGELVPQGLAETAEETATLSAPPPPAVSKRRRRAAA